MKNAMVMPTVLMVTLFISILIGTYMMNTSVNISREYHRDLAEVRGYWGAYGAKELNVSDIRYEYENYNIDVNQSGDDYVWEWNLTTPVSKSSGIKNKDLYIRKITLENNDSNKIKSYEGN